MLYLIEQKNKRGIPLSSAVVGAYWEPHAMDIYGFRAHISEDDQVTITPLVKNVREKPLYIEVNRFGEFVKFSFDKIEPSKKGNQVNCILVSDEITNIYELTKNTT